MQHAEDSQASFNVDKPRPIVTIAQSPFVVGAPELLYVTATRLGKEINGCDDTRGNACV